MKTQITQQVTIKAAAQTIAQTADLYLRKDDTGAYCVARRRARPLCLIGPAGIGKTEVVRQVAEEKGLCFLSYSITHHTRQSVIGLPRMVPHQQGDETVYTTEYTVSEIIAEVYRTMARTGKSEGILFLDEFNCASETLRPIMLQLLQDKSFGPHKIPDGWMLVLAGNPTDYNRSVTEIDAVTADRMRMVYVEPDFAVWRDYAVRRQVHPVVLSYLDNHPEHFYVFCKDKEGMGIVTPRGWEDLSVQLTEMELAHYDADLPLLSQYLQVSQVARSFMTYYRQYQGIIAGGMVADILAGRNLLQHLTALSDAPFEKSWALTSVLLNRLQVLGDRALRADATAAAAFGVLDAVKTAEDRGSALAGQLDAVENLPARAFLLSLLETLSAEPAEQAWQKVKERFSSELRARRQEQFEGANAAISNTIRFLSEVFADGPQLEFLLNGITTSPSCAEVIAESGNEAYRAVCESIYFDARKSSQELGRAVKELVG
ncbi:MAG: MoxR family ATPase [Oscillospiraceae bacterium]